MTSSTRTRLWLVVAALSATAFAQSTDLAPVSAVQSGNVWVPTNQSALALNFGRRILGPIDIQSPITANPAPGTAWNRLLGVEQAWGYWWVSGGAGTTGAFAIHQYSTSGVYIQSFPQTVFSATAWGARDLEVDEANFKLYGGMEGNVIAEYTFNPGGGPNGTLTFTTSYTLPGGPGTIRALARDPANGHFFTKNFSTAMYEFTLSPLVVVNTWSANGKATYGLAWDTLNNTLWQFDQFPVAATDAVEFNEVNPADGTLTGRTFPGVIYGVANQNVSGGCDIFNDGSGYMKILSLHQNTLDEVNVYQLDPTTTPPVVFCTAGTTTNTCNASMSFSGTPSASASSGFTLICSTVEGQKSGIQFYGINGQFIQPWATGSTSFLCVKTPTQRMTTQNSGGNAGACDGTIQTDFLAFIAANPSSLGTPLAAGQVFDAQTWFRDPPAPKTTNLSDALEFTLGP